MRGRSYSYSPSPPRGYGRRGRSPSPRARGRYAGHGRDLPTSLLVRNLRHDCRPEDLRRPFGQFGPVKDIYLPRDYYTGEPRGFGFIQYCESSDAIEAKYQMDGQIFFGRELTVVFAEENRKKPADMRARERRGRRQSPLCYSPSPRSPPRHYTRSPLRNHDYSRSPKRRHYSRSISPRRRDPSCSPRGRDHHHRSASPESKQYGRERSRHRRERSYSPQASPAYSRSRSRSRSLES